VAGIEKTARSHGICNIPIPDEFLRNDAHRAHPQSLFKVSGRPGDTVITDGNGTVIYIASMK